MSTSKFLAIVGVIIAVAIGTLAALRIMECREKGGVACCFGKYCDAQRHESGNPRAAK
jgi:hypothetical protein